MNKSRKPLYPTHTRVTGPFRGVGVVDSNEGSAVYGQKEVCNVRRRISVGKGVVIWPYHESELSRISVWRFFFHRAPEGDFQIGNNSLWPWLITMILYSLFIWGIRGEEGPWFTATRIIFPTFAALYLLYTARQYFGKSK